jgi:hypothetical protein
VFDKTMQKCKEVQSGELESLCFRARYVERLLRFLTKFYFLTWVMSTKVCDLYSVA